MRSVSDHPPVQGRGTRVLTGMANPTPLEGRGKGRSPLVALRLRRSTMVALDELVAESGLSKSVLLRTAVEEYVAAGVAVRTDSREALAG